MIGLNWITHEGDPKVNGLPSLLFKHLFSEVEPGVKKDSYSLEK